MKNWTRNKNFYERLVWFKCWNREKKNNLDYAWPLFYFVYSVRDAGKVKGLKNNLEKIKF